MLWHDDEDDDNDDDDDDNQERRCIRKRRNAFNLHWRFSPLLRTVNLAMPLANFTSKFRIYCFKGQSFFLQKKKQ